MKKDLYSFLHHLLEFWDWNDGLGERQGGNIYFIFLAFSPFWLNENCGRNEMYSSLEVRGTPWICLSVGCINN